MSKYIDRKCLTYFMSAENKFRHKIMLKYGDRKCGTYFMPAENVSDIFDR